MVISVFRFFYFYKITSVIDFHNHILMVLSLRRTILGFDVQDGESEDNWDTVFQSFVQRGLFGVKLVISDAHKG
ncbi:hypothetical protein EfmJHP36_21080 [Enterococcus faecium]|nr:hypothetical protein EfmJHP36_21080 [Enterococcus faecium]